MADLPGNVRQTLVAVLDMATNGAGVADGDETDDYIIGDQTASLGLVADLIGSVLAHPEMPRHEHMAIHWTAAEKRRDERKAADL